ncbi:MAG: hypothetical protein ACTSX6_04540 [Candidatus Heimdallarchaeaceae archaeon]
MKSPIFNLKGWNFSTYLKGRKKLMITLLGAIGGWIVTQNPAWSAIVATATELIVAVIEYWLKETEY